MSYRLARLVEIHSGASTSSQKRWLSTGFFDAEVFAAPGNTPVYFKRGFTECKEIPGLPLDSQFDGVSSFQNHVVFWVGPTLKWSDVNDFTMWIPVALTATSLVLSLQREFTQEAVGIENDWVYVNEPTDGLTVGQFLQMIQDPAYDFFEVTEVSTPANFSGATISANQSVTGANQNVYTKTFVDWVPGSHIGTASEKKPLQVSAHSLEENFTATTNASFTVPAVNSSVIVTLTSIPAFTVGEFVSVNTASAQVGSDIYKVSGKNPGANTVTLQRMGVGNQQQLTGDSYGAGSLLISQPFVTVTPSFDADEPIFVDNDETLIPMYGFKVKSLDFTGRSATGTVFEVNRQILTVDANEAGEVVNSGSNINGAILQFMTLGDRGYIFKERSIQSVQYVGRDAGTFGFFPEITDEGLYGRYTLKKIGEDFIIFLGQRELYIYKGGKDLVPVAKQFSRQLFKDLNRARADEIVFHHHEGRDEIVIVYYSVDQTQKQFIYNFVENSCTFDVYPESKGDITAMGTVLWQDDVRWIDVPTPWSTHASESWLDLLGQGNITSISLIGFSPDDEVTLAESDNVIYNYDGDPYTAICETVDFDFDDSTAWKYIDTLDVALQITQELNPRPVSLYVQIGARDNLDSDIRWSEPEPLEVSGNGMYVSSVNIRRSGRYIRVRFYSSDLDIQWRVSSYKLSGRKGGYY
jgi:hypothetical protein